MAKQYWLVKQEPESYSWSDFVKDGGTQWTGIRNYQARLNLRAMKAGDLVFFYHSVSEKQVVGVAKVSREHFPDPTAKEGDWSAVELQPVKPLKKPVTLDQIKADKALKDMVLVRNSRLSTQPVTEAQARRLLELSETKVWVDAGTRAAPNQSRFASNCAGTSSVVSERNTFRASLITRSISFCNG